MDYQKLDAGLASVLDDTPDPAERNLTVFILTRGGLTNDQLAFLRRCGVNDVTPDRQVFTATLSARTEEEVSDQPWVRSLKLSSRLRLLS